MSRSRKAYRPVPLSTYERLDENEMIERARAFRDGLRRRRTVRHYSGEPVPQEVIEACIEAAGAAPNGANRQLWHFVVVRDPEVKSRIRKQAEEEELDFYENRAPPEWLEALAHLGTDSHKPFLEEAPVLIAIFAESYRLLGGEKVKNYYVTESVGIATGMLITGLHRAGLATLTHTPSPMGFLNEILGRPKNERPFLLLVVGYPVDEALVPTSPRSRSPKSLRFSSEGLGGRGEQVAAGGSETGRLQRVPERDPIGLLQGFPVRRRDRARSERLVIKQFDDLFDLAG